MKIALWAYFDNNLGDDLMVKKLLDSFPEYDFFTQYQNDVIVQTFKDNHNLSFLTKDEYKKALKSCKYYISIGGSIFNNINSFKGKLIRISKLIKYIKLKLSGIEIYTLGCNVGPFSDKIAEILCGIELKLNDGITVRDKESYEFVISYNKKVEQYDDIVFSYDINTKKVKESNNILGVSVYRSLNPKVKNYGTYYLLARIIDDFLKRTKGKCRLYCFDSENENDLSAAFHIKELSHKSEDIDVVPYIGNVEKFLSSFSECSSLISFRFHGTILGEVFGIPTLPIAYSNKLINFLTENNYIDYYLIDDFNKDKIIPSQIVDRLISRKLYTNFCSRNGIGHIKYIKKILKDN